MNMSPLITFISENKRVAALGFVALVIIIVYLIIQPEEEPDTAVNISLATHVSAETDTDNDGIPDWLEDVSGSDYLDVTDFPYREDIARAENIGVDDILYGGPGEFAEEVMLRFLTSDPEDLNVTDEEKERLITDTANYYIAKSEERGVPAVQLSVNNGVSRSEVLEKFTDAFVVEGLDTIIEEVILDAVDQGAARVPAAARFKDMCNDTINNAPREVPGDVYDSYFMVLERVVYLCEALNVALTDNTIYGFFHILRLMSLGKLFESASQNIDPFDAEEVYTALTEHVATITFLLSRPPEV